MSCVLERSNIFDPTGDCHRPQLRLSSNFLLIKSSGFVFTNTWYVDPLWLNALVKTFGDCAINRYKEILDRQSLKQLGNINSRLEAQRKRLGELDKERLEALRNANNGSLSSDEKDEVIAYITSDKSEIQENIDKLEEQQQVKQSAIEYALNFMHDVQRLWIDADPDLKIRFQKMIFPEGLTLDTSTVTFGTSTISPLYTYAPSKKTYLNQISLVW